MAKNNRNIKSMCRCSKTNFTGYFNSSHLTNPERKWGINYFTDVLNENNYNYDILSTSYYPFWHGDLTNLKNKFNYIEETYNKKF